MTAAATTARLAIWSAIDHWSDLNPNGVSLFKRKIKHDEDAGSIPSNQPNGIGDLPFVEVGPLAENPAWQVHRMQQVPYSISVSLGATRLATLEDLVEKTIKAIYQAADPSTPTMSYVRAATGYLVESTQTTYARGPASKEAPRSPKSWGAVITVLLKFNRDPLGNT